MKDFTSDSGAASSQEQVNDRWTKGLGVTARENVIQSVVHARRQSKFAPLLATVVMFVVRTMNN